VNKYLKHAPSFKFYWMGLRMFLLIIVFGIPAGGP
jgi:hypothetical protein